MQISNPLFFEGWGRGAGGGGGRGREENYSTCRLLKYLPSILGRKRNTISRYVSDIFQVTASVLKVQGKVWKYSIKALRAISWQNIPSHLCALRRLKSACSSAQFYQSSLSTWRNFATLCAPVKIQIRLRHCVVWSESSQDAHVCG